VKIETFTMSITVNNKAIAPQEVPVGTKMIEFLNEYLDLTGTRLSCGAAQCRACSVIIDADDGTSDEMVTCIMDASFFNGKKIRTIEGHATYDDKGQVIKLSPVQEKFLEHFSFQCGYCTPGFVNAATVLIERLKKNPAPKDQVEKLVMEALDSHICRCSGYVRYFEAVKDLVLNTDGLTT
jgi:xanthine dehydrogenase YagT iron-sulfur-binding subunit